MERSGLFNSENGDRKYNAKVFAKMISLMISNGVYFSPANNLQVTVINNSMKVKISDGIAFINGYIYENKNGLNDELTFTLPSSPNGDIIYRVVLRLDSEVDRLIRAYVINGDVSKTPVAPQLVRNDKYYDICLAEILVKEGQTFIQSSDIKDTRLSNELCGITRVPLEHLKTEEVFRQFNEWFKEQKVILGTDLTNWEDEYKKKYEEFKNIQEQAFNDWFDKVKLILDSNPNSALINEMDKLRKDMSSMMEIYKNEIYDSLEKFKNDIKNNPSILGFVKTVNNKLGDSNGNVDIKATDIKTTDGKTVESQLADMMNKAGKVGAKEVDESNIKDNYTLRYDAKKDKLVYVDSKIDRSYGVRWTKSTDTVERLGGAIGKIAITGGQNDFNSLIPWSGIKRCNLSDNGTVNAYYGSPAYKVDGSNGQVMVEIPKFWYKVVNVNEDIIEFWISDVAKEGYEVHPAFFRDRLHLCDDNSGTTTEVDYRYIGAYEATEYTGSVYQGGNGYSVNSPTYNSSYKLSSVSGFYPIANRNLSEFRTLAKNRGNGWGQQDYYLTYAIQLLYLVEYAHFNSQEKIGNGNSNSTTILKTGATDSYGNNSYGTTANTTTDMSYRGIENFYANIYKWIDGLYSDSNRKVFFVNKGFTDNCTNYNNSYATGLSANINGYTSDIWGDKTMGFIPKAVNGSATTKLCDYGSLYGGCVAVFGGGYGSGARCGCFCLGLDASPSASRWDYSARLAF